MERALVSAGLAIAGEGEGKHVVEREQCGIDNRRERLARHEPQGRSALEPPSSCLVAAALSSLLAWPCKHLCARARRGRCCSVAPPRPPLSSSCAALAIAPPARRRLLRARTHERESSCPCSAMPGPAPPLGEGPARTRGTSASQLAGWGRVTRSRRRVQRLALAFFALSHPRTCCCTGPRCRPEPCRPARPPRSSKSAICRTICAAFSRARWPAVRPSSSKPTRMRRTS